MESASKVNPDSLPLPTVVPDDADPTHPVEHLSVIFSQKQQSDVLRISKKATTPFWLNKRMYEKLNTDIKFKLGPIDSQALEQKYKEFVHGGAPQTVKDKAAQLFHDAYYAGKSKDDQLKAQHILKGYLDNQK